MGLVLEEMLVAASLGQHRVDAVQPCLIDEEEKISVLFQVSP